MKKFDIKSATTESYSLFNTIRHKSLRDFPPGLRYWDIVVLTASDEDQKSAYDIQIREKLEREEIPSAVKYHVFADPPGPRIGCGGATMQAIVNLQEIYGADELKNNYVLLINAGGQSQRLPSASVLGKIFSPLPIGECVRKDGEDCKAKCGSANWQLLELKLACYTPLLRRMKPGFMHVASDTIEVFDIGEDSKDHSLSSDWNFEQPGMTALAHPSSLDIGRTHGVFVLDKQDNVVNSLAVIRNCSEVLQKPSLEEMRRKGAIVENTQTCQFGGSALAMTEFVYTDSAFYFDHSFASKLASFYHDNYPLGCEIDGYGDFMRSLGPLADDKFTTDTRNVSTSSPAELSHLIEMKKRLFDCLRGTPLNVVVMNASKFYHLGTMMEYTENLCDDEELSGYLGFRPTIFSAISTPPEADSSSIALMTPVCRDFPGHGRRLVHSIVSASTDIGCSSIVEYCQLTYPQGFKIGRGCILSNCSYTARSVALIISDLSYL